MASFSEYANRLKTCPYNPNHKVSATKFAGHIVKCADRLDTPYLKECPFNSLHRIKADDYYTHVRDCPNYDPVMAEIIAAKEKQQKEEEEAGASTGQS